MSRHHLLLNQRRWQALRRRILDRDAWRCQTCGMAGRLEVDHLVPLEDGGDPWSESNLQALCRGCHIAKTAAENRARRPASASVLAWRQLVDELLDLSR